LIHGGLRYLGNLEFGLVREALRERATLLSMAPALVEPLAFLLPFYSRSARLYYGAGLALYDLLAGGRRIARHRVLSRAEALELEPALASRGLASAALFHDAHVNSARFVLANVFDALGHGAFAANHLRAGTPARDGGLWRVSVTDALSGAAFDIAARKLVDTTGPWSAAALRLVRGSHVVLPRLTSGTHAAAWFDDSGRIVFVIPWGEAGDLSLAGTTDVDHDRGPDDVRISAAELDYLLGIVKRIFPGSRAEPVATFSALRPLLPHYARSATRASREHRIWNSPDGILHVAGGKYTTYRLMSEEAADAVAREIAPKLAALHVTADAPLPAAKAPADRTARIAFAIEEDMARRLADLMFVSTYWGYEQQWTRAQLEPYACGMGARLGWSDARTQEEIDTVLCQTAMPELS
jgi:glycerol-3-phosphate dehydrogenase